MARRPYNPNSLATGIVGCHTRRTVLIMTSNDISTLLRKWPHEPGKLNVRIFEAEDGRECIQLRIELGVVQMELHGRPDGIEQGGCSSLLAMYESQGIGEGLSPEACRQLREEGVQRSHRAAALFALSRFEDVIRDCNRNLAIFDICNTHALDEQDTIALEQFRPAVIALRTRASAEWSVSLENTIDAMASLDEGLEILVSLLGDEAEHSNEVQLLRGMKEALVPRLPTSERADLQERLASAIANENYELAAILRDEIRLLRD